jgi:hypothetical protein
MLIDWFFPNSTEPFSFLLFPLVPIYGGREQEDVSFEPFSFSLGFVRKVPHSGRSLTVETTWKYEEESWEGRNSGMNGREVKGGGGWRSEMVGNIGHATTTATTTDDLGTDVGVSRRFDSSIRAVSMCTPPPVCLYLAICLSVYANLSGQLERRYVCPQTSWASRKSS